MVRKARKSIDPAFEEARQRFAQKLAQHTANVGENATAVAGLLLFRRTSPTPCYCGAYEPSFNLFAQGRKQVKLGENTYDCDGFSYLISSTGWSMPSRLSVD